MQKFSSFINEDTTQVVTAVARAISTYRSCIQGFEAKIVMKYFLVLKLKVGVES